jgi:hypothetical protein
MYVNGKMRPVETIPGTGRGIKEKDAGGKNFCKCHNVAQYNNNKN